MYCKFESGVKDKKGGALLRGYYIDFEMARDVGDEIGKKDCEYGLVEKVIKQTGGTRGGFLTMMLSPINDLRVELELDQLPKYLKDKWIKRRLERHLRTHADTIIAAREEKDPEEVHEEMRDKSDLSTMLLCRSENLVYLTNNSGQKTMLVNPNIPTSDWFRCVNYSLCDKNRDFRLLPFLTQHSSVDDVYVAVAVDMEEFEMFKRLQTYGTQMKHDHAQLWEITLNFAEQMLRKNAQRDVYDISMFKDRTLVGVLISGCDYAEMCKITKRLDITMV